MTDTAEYVAGADLVLLKCQGGRTLHLYENDRVPPDADPEHLEYLIAQGMIVEAGARRLSRRERQATEAPQPSRTKRIQEVNGRLAEASRLLERTSNELRHVTTSGMAPDQFNVRAHREAAPTSASAWAARISDGLAKLDELVGVLRPLFVEAQETAEDLAAEMGEELRVLLAAEAEEKRQDDIDRAVAAAVADEKRRQDEKLAAKFRAELEGSVA